MPVNPTYPGVYIEEVPSGVRTIVGVATSIAAFIGRAPRGPVDEPIIIFNFGDFERTFGGLHVDYPLAYAVSDFYRNGGGQAIIVRVFKDDTKEAKMAAEAAAEAARTVAKATEDSQGQDATAVAADARTAAEAIKNDQGSSQAEKDAAEAVAKAAEGAAGQQNATPDGVKQASAQEAKKHAITAHKLNPNSRAKVYFSQINGLPEPAAKAAASRVTKATEDSKGQDAATVAADAKTAAEAIKNDQGSSQAEKDAAEAVAKAAGGAAGQQNATANSVKQAAKNVVITGPLLNELSLTALAAAETVAKAAEDSQGQDATAVAQDARKVANEIKNNQGSSRAEKDAGEAVAKAAEGAAGQQNATPDDVKKAVKGLVDNTFTIECSSPGQWGNNLKLEIIHASDSRVLERYGLKTAGVKIEHLFNIRILDASNPDAQEDPVLETIQNVSLHPSAGSRRIDRVLEEESAFIRFNGSIPNSGNPSRPAEFKAALANGKDSGNLDEATYTGSQAEKTGLYALEKADLFNLLCIPPDIRDGNTKPGVYTEALKYCVDRRAMLIVDPPNSWNKVADAVKGIRDSANEIGISGPNGRNAALYFPRVKQADPLREGQLDTFVPCGLVAGAMARNDVQRGVWKAPAGIDVSVNGVRALSVKMTNDENGRLNPLGVNCLRNFPIIGNVIWGARTLRGADLLADEYKYVPIRRLALFIEESLYRGTQWVVFEPNDEPLWAQIRLNVGAFMHDLFRLGAFQGSSPREAYLVKCDKENNPQSDINKGIVNILVGFAPLKPAEFVILKIQQLTGQIET